MSLLPAEFDQEMENSRRCVAAVKLLRELDVDDVKFVYRSWMQVESDWPCDTILYTTTEDVPMTALITDNAVALVIGWDSPE